MIRLYLQNLGFCILAMLACAAVAFLMTYPIGFVFYNEALRFRVAGGSIETRLLDDFDAMQRNITLLGSIVGLLTSQTVFLMHNLRLRITHDSSIQQ